MANRTVMQHGQLHLDPRRKDRSAPPGLGRLNGAPKRTQTGFALTPGMRDVGASGHPLAFVGGKRPLDDEPMEKHVVTSRKHIGQPNTKRAPAHPGMTDRQVASNATSVSAKDILDEKPGVSARQSGSNTRCAA